MKRAQARMCFSGGRAPLGSAHNGVGQISVAVLTVRRSSPGGSCVAVTGSPSQMQALSLPKRHCHRCIFLFLVFFPSPCCWGLFFHEEKGLINCGSQMRLMPWQRWPFEVGQKSLSCGVRRGSCFLWK